MSEMPQRAELKPSMPSRTGALMSELGQKQATIRDLTTAAEIFGDAARNAA